MEARTPKIRSAQQFLFDYGIDTLKLNDDFNTGLFAAMERYAEAYASQTPAAPVQPDTLSKEDLYKLAWQSWEKVNAELYQRGGVNPSAYVLGFKDGYQLSPALAVAVKV